MQIDGSKQNFFTRNQGNDTPLAGTAEPENLCFLDSTVIGPTKQDNLLINMFKMRDMAVAGGGSASIPCAAAGRTGFSVQNLSLSNLNVLEVSRARNNEPIVIVHGTMATETSIQKYKDAAVESGHPTDLYTYCSIKEGEPLQKSGQLISEHINTTRIESVKRELERLEPYRDDPLMMKQLLSMGNDLYGEPDPKVDALIALVPGVMNRLEALLKKDPRVLAGTYSRATKEIEEQLAEEVAGTGFGDGDKKIAAKVAAELMDTISPKVVLLGHSMGGFVSYTIALNPRGKGEEENIFTYDGGNGVSSVITLSSPVGKGVPDPLPWGLETLTYDLVDKNMLQPLEKTPAMQIAEMNPFFAAGYAFNKALLKEAMRQSMIATTSMTSPMIWAMKPGVEQITEGSQFIRNYVEGKKVPEGITMISISCKDDGISVQDHSLVDDSQLNAYNLDAHVTVTDEDLKDPRSTRPTMTHLKMAQYPVEHGNQFRHEILENPKHIVRLLDRSNYDGVRWRCLTVLAEDQAKNPDFLSKPEFKPVIAKLREVAAEKLPFTDSPSYVASQILKKMERAES